MDDAELKDDELHERRMARRAAERAKIARLEKALEPFAKAADNYADCTDESRFVDNDATITVADIREARAALTPDQH